MNKWKIGIHDLSTGSGSTTCGQVNIEKVRSHKDIKSLARPLGDLQSSDKEEPLFLRAPSLLIV